MIIYLNLGSPMKPIQSLGLQLLLLQINQSIFLTGIDPAVIS